MEINAIIIDDEIMARNLLKGMLEEYCSHVNVLETCADLPSGILAIRKLQPDIVFLDIEMPGYSGLEILNFFNEDEMDFGIVFTTSYNEYAVQAFKLSAVDYLLKPIEPQDLIQSVELFQKRKINTGFQQLRRSLNLNTPMVKKIPIHLISSIVYIEVEKIMFMKADRAYTKIFLSDGTSMLASKSLKHFENMVISEPNFLRVHKSYIANLNYVSELVKSNGGYLKIRDYEVSISADKINQFIELMSM